MSESEAPSMEWTYSKERRFRCLESLFRLLQAFMLVLLIFCFALYLIFFGIDMAKYSNNLIQLFFVVVLDVLALFFIALGVRGVALEVLPLVLVSGGAFAVITAGHCVTLLYRHRGISICSIVLDASLSLIALYFSYLLYRFNNSKPNDYDQMLEDAYGRKVFVYDEAGALVVIPSGGKTNNFSVINNISSSSNNNNSQGEHTPFKVDIDQDGGVSK